MAADSPNNYQIPSLLQIRTNIFRIDTVFKNVFYFTGKLVYGKNNSKLGLLTQKQGSCCFTIPNNEGRFDCSIFCCFLIKLWNTPSKAEAENLNSLLFTSINLFMPGQYEVNHKPLWFLFHLRISTIAWSLPSSIIITFLAPRISIKSRWLSANSSEGFTSPYIFFNQILSTEFIMGFIWEEYRAIISDN